MPDTRTAVADAATVSRVFPDLPLVMWMVLLTLVLGLANGRGAEEVIGLFNTGFGRALGEFALILLPSFTLAAALSRWHIASEATGRTAGLASPVAGAGMICPDTAYAALSPAAGRHKLATVFGAYTGFKLLYPAGPLIVAAGLDGAIPDSAPPLVLLAAGIALTPPVWAAGMVWVRLVNGAPVAGKEPEPAPASGRLWIAFAPFVLMAALLALGGLAGQTGLAAADFFLSPKGALIAAAVLAVAQTPASARRGCMEAAVRRTGSLLLLIGAASAFGAAVTGAVPLDRLVPEGGGPLTLLALFALTAAFKLAQGSSMATFAAVSPVAAPIVAASGTDPLAAVFAICLGSFVAILPNDSFYWLVRGDALAEEKREARAVYILAGASAIQALTGMALLLVWVLIPS